MTEEYIPAFPKPKDAPKGAQITPAEHKLLPFGKTPPVRVKGKDMKLIRMKRFLVDNGRCVVCGERVSLDGKHPKLKPMHLAHVTGRGANGADTVENTRTKCSFCHLVKEHADEKPCPAKERTDASREA